MEESFTSTNGAFGIRRKLAEWPKWAQSGPPPKAAPPFKGGPA